MVIEDCYFPLHKKDFLKGLCYNTKWEQDSIVVSGTNAVFISSSFDSTQNGTVWHRAKIVSEGRFIKLSFYAADSKQVNHAGQNIDLDEFIKNAGCCAKKINCLAEADFWGREYIDADDILLHDYSGRYLWIKFEFVNVGDAQSIKQLKLYFPAGSFVRYLPEIYQQGDISFLTGFLGMFQSLYLDMDQAIADVPKQLDPVASPRLDMLCSWMEMKEFDGLFHPKQREFLLQSALLYNQWGTKDCMANVLELVCGQSVCIVEHFELKNFPDRLSLERLYGNVNFSFAVILKKEYDNNTMTLIQRLIEGMKPAHTTYRLIVLQEAMRLDSYTYLGVNSVVSGYNQPRLDVGIPMENLMI